MAVGLSHVAGAPSRGEESGACPLLPPPYNPTHYQRFDGGHGFRRQSTPDGEGKGSLLRPEIGSPGLVREEPGVIDHAWRRTPSIKGCVMHKEKRSRLLIVY